MSSVIPGPEVRAGLSVDCGGSGLATDVTLPGTGTGPTPVVVMRTPYDRAALRDVGLGYARRGFAFVAQDVRGRYGSPGTWRPYRDERTDGADLLAWVRDQPWCDGRVVTAGASYAAYTAWAAAVEGGVQALVSQVPAMGVRRTAFDPGGILRLTEHLGWWSEHGESRTSRTGLASSMLRTRPGLLSHLPVQEIGTRSWARLEDWWDVVADGPTSPRPEEVDDRELEELAVPTLHIGGWYDLFLPQTLHHWSVVGAAHSPRPPRSLLVGPWAHALSAPGRQVVGEREHGPESQVRLGQHITDWLWTALDEPARSSSPVELGSQQVYLVGADTWLDRWPPPGRSTPWYLDGERRLSPALPGRAGAAQLRHDPLDPQPSVLPAHDRSHLDVRDDVLVHRSQPLPEPLTLAGTPRLDVEVDADGPADWIAILAERLPDGRIIQISRGAASTPSGAHHVTVPMEPLAVRLPTGSCLELRISGSDFPWLARNLGTGDRYTSVTTRPVNQLVRIGPAGSSVLHLPLLTQPEAP